VAHLYVPAVCIQRGVVLRLQVASEHHHDISWRGSFQGAVVRCGVPLAGHVVVLPHLRTQAQGQLPAVLLGVALCTGDALAMTGHVGMLLQACARRGEAYAASFIVPSLCHRAPRCSRTGPPDPCAACHL
jgi:hypothetical protein